MQKVGCVGQTAGMRQGSWAWIGVCLRQVWAARTRDGCLCAANFMVAVDLRRTAQLEQG